ncbi:MAG: hypothetical protein U0838_02610 [Chloroflexota bacterium]
MTAQRADEPGAPRRPVRLPPFRRRAFWVVQGLVLLIAVAHTALETVGQVQFPPALYLVPSSLFFIPVVYAALEFGVAGAVPTALWAAVLTLPNLVFLHHGLDRLGVLWQAAILMAIGVLVGYAVDRERRARDEAEAREAARLASEARYRARSSTAPARRSSCSTSTAGWRRPTPPRRACSAGRPNRSGASPSTTRSGPAPRTPSERRGWSRGPAASMRRAAAPRGCSPCSRARSSAAPVRPAGR